MSQYDFATIDPYVWDGVQLADALNQWRNALHTMHRGASRPAYAVAGMMWINDSAGAANWVVNVYLGAAGDKPLFNYNTTTGAITMSAATGGTLTAAHLLAQAAADPSMRWDATGNPIDQKRWRAVVTGDGSLRFTAYSDADVAGSYVEFSRTGALTGTTLGGQVVSEVNLAAPAASMNFYSLPQATIEMSFYLAPTTADAALGLRVATATTPNTGTVYNLSRHAATGATITADYLAAQNTWMLASAVSTSGITGVLHFPRLSSTVGGRGTGQAHNINTAGNPTIFNFGFASPGGDGFQLAFASGNIATGSRCRIIAWL